MHWFEKRRKRKLLKGFNFKLVLSFCSW